jgi:hypothetical protein
VTALTSRAEWEQALGRILAPVVEHASPGCARVALPGGRPSAFGDELDGFEAFARSLWGAGAWLSTSRSGTLAGTDLSAFYRTGLVNGTDPVHPESWYPLLEVRQTLAEAAAVAWNVVLARPHLWDPLSERERAHVLRWLAEAARIPGYDCNWRLFSVVVQTALKLLGGEYYESRIALELERVDQWHVGDGWYDDFQTRGRTRTLDYYNATVFHPYLLFWAHVDGDSLPQRRTRVHERARMFLAAFPYWFASDGSFPCFGRSGSYRCAVLHAPIWGVLTGTSPLPLGQVRRLCRLTVQRFLDAPETFGAHGELTRGFTRSHPAFVEPYSGRGSPYWATKAFALLALPAEHPFWRAEEEPLPIETTDYTVATAGGSFLLHGSRDDGHVQVVNADSLVVPKKYSNLSYSTHFGYELDGHIGVDDRDPFGEASLTFSLDGETWYRRREAQRLAADGGVLLTQSKYVLPQRDTRVRVTVISAVTFIEDAQLRVHRVEAKRPVSAREGGFACGWDGERMPVLVAGALSYAAADGRASAVRPLLGYDVAPTPHTGDCNVLYEHSAVPHVRTAHARRGTFYLASISLARARPFTPPDVPDVEPASIDALLAVVDRAADGGGFRASSRRKSAVAMRRSGTR